MLKKLEKLKTIHAWAMITVQIKVASSILICVQLIFKWLYFYILELDINYSPWILLRSWILFTNHLAEMSPLSRDYSHPPLLVGHSWHLSFLIGRSFMYFILSHWKVIHVIHFSWYVIHVIYFSWYVIHPFSLVGPSSFILSHW